MSQQSQDADVAFVKALAEVLRDNDLTQIEVKRLYGEDDSMTVKVSRAALAAAPVAPPAPQGVVLPRPEAAATPAPADIP